MRKLSHSINGDCYRTSVNSIVESQSQNKPFTETTLQVAQRASFDTKVLTPLGNLLSFEQALAAWFSLRQDETKILNASCVFASIESTETTLWSREPIEPQSWNEQRLVVQNLLIVVMRQRFHSHSIHRDPCTWRKEKRRIRACWHQRGPSSLCTLC